MQADRENFMAMVKEQYVQNPCQVSGIAFWKLAQLCRESETYSLIKKGSTVLYAIRNQRLEFYWSDDRRNFLLRTNELKELDFFVLHEDFYRLIADQVVGYQVRESRPLLYNFTFRHEPNYSDEFVIENFDFELDQDYVVAANMLNRCYDTQHHIAAEIARWCELPAFDESLWFWVKSRATKQAVGLGISTYQASIRECYLDWIQVLPEYQGRGLGRLLVSETITRARRKSDIIRVTGVVDDFYRKCGFVGTESWRIISKQ